jgi:DNA-binding IclR family transcriptional regulator
MPAVQPVAPAARALAAHVGETVHVAALERESVVYVASERPPERFALRRDVYERALAASKRVSRGVRL